MQTSRALLGIVYCIVVCIVIYVVNSICKKKKKKKVVKNSNFVSLLCNGTVRYRPTRNLNYKSPLVSLGRLRRTHQTHNVSETLLQRRCNVTALQRRCNDVVATLCLLGTGGAKYEEVYILYT